MTAGLIAASIFAHFYGLCFLLCLLADKQDYAYASLNHLVLVQLFASFLAWFETEMSAQ